MSETRKIRLKFSAQAMLLVRQSARFDMDHFADWLMKEGFPVGSSNVLEYMIIQDSRLRQKDPTGETVEIVVRTGLNGAVR